MLIIEAPTVALNGSPRATCAHRRALSWGQRLAPGADKAGKLHLEGSLPGI